MVFADFIENCIMSINKGQVLRREITSYHTLTDLRFLFFTFNLVYSITFSKFQFARFTDKTLTFKSSTH